MARRLLCLGAFLLAVSAQAQVPRVLIVYQGSGTDEVDVYASLPNLLAEFLSESGKISTVLWGLEDPMFRQSALDGKLTAAVEDLSDRNVQKAAEQLGATYTIRVRTISKDGKTQAEAQLFRGTRREWQNRTELSVVVGTTNSPFDASRSIANTWATQLFMGPFKGLSTAPVATAPTPEPGQIRLPAAGIEPNAVLAVSNADLEKSVMEFLKAGRAGEAVYVLRTAVDESPLDLTRREWLVNALRSAGKPDLAADAALAALVLDPSNDAIRQLSVTCLLEAGDSTRAQEILNELASKNPEDARVRMLMADLALGQGKPEPAKLHLTAINDLETNPDALLRLAQCEAMLGSKDAALASLEKARAKQANEPDRFATLFDQVDLATGADMLALRDLLPRVVVSNQRSAAAAQVAGLMRKAEARNALLEKWQPGEKYRKISERALLAYKLFVVALEGIANYAEAPAESLLIDSRLDLGEALKLAREAREAFLVARG